MIIKRIFVICVICFATLTLTGCLGGGGGGGGSSSSGTSGISTDIFASSPGTGSGGSDAIELPPASGSAVVAVHNPEPSSMLLLGSGLLGMVLARRKKYKK